MCSSERGSGGESVGGKKGEVMGMQSIPVEGQLDTLLCDCMIAESKQFFFRHHLNNPSLPVHYSPVLTSACQRTHIPVSLSNNSLTLL